MRKLILLLAVLALPGPAQSLGFGVKGGTNPTDWFNTENGHNVYIDKSGGHTFGPAVELRLPFRLAVEADALYRSYGYEYSGGIGGYAISGSSDAHSWEFPVLAKYRLWSQPFTPFVAAGPTFRHLGEQSLVSSCTGSLCGTLEGTQNSKGPSFTKTGLVLAGGLEVKAILPRLSVELRYTRIGQDLGFTSSNQLSTKQNQFTVLFGLMF